MMMMVEGGQEFRGCLDVVYVGMMMMVEDDDLVTQIFKNIFKPLSNPDLQEQLRLLTQIFKNISSSNRDLQIHNHHHHSLSLCGATAVHHRTPPPAAAIEMKMMMFG
ncbi:hypothetical protein HanOQP8_Chr12g0449291 [Helianthus annuus]|nr:hypothetical protein HanOQP8_Chr12g0449291 [Helianthus annuus]